MQLKIKIRHESESSESAVQLAEVPFRPDAIDTIISTIEGWGLIDVTRNLAAEDLVGQFIKTETEAYFEVVIPE